MTYTVTPKQGYALDTVTLCVGDRQATASVKSDAIKVGSRSYPMTLSNKGILKVTVSNVRDDVKLDAYAVRETGGTLYLRSGITEPYFEGMGKRRFCPENTLNLNCHWAKNSPTKGALSGKRQFFVVISEVTAKGRSGT